MFLVGRAGACVVYSPSPFFTGNYLATCFSWEVRNSTPPTLKVTSLGENMDLKLPGQSSGPGGVSGEEEAGHVGGVARPPAAMGIRSPPHGTRGAVETCAWGRGPRGHTAETHPGPTGDCL